MSDECKYTRESKHYMYTPECGTDYDAVHPEDITEWEFCPYCGDKIQAYTGGKKKAHQ